MSMFAQAFAAASLDQTDLNFGVPAVYTPLGGSPVSLTVLIERTEILADDGRVILAAEDRWVLVRADVYAAEPAAGDRIVVGGETYVVSLAAGQKYVWEWADRFNLRRRVYAKRISASVPA